MKHILDDSCGETQNTYFVFNNFFFSRKSCPLWDNVEKYGVAMYVMKMCMWVVWLGFVGLLISASEFN